jgi:hypothetical protein
MESRLSLNAYIVCTHLVSRLYLNLKIHTTHSLFSVVAETSQMFLQYPHILPK